MSIFDRLIATIAPHECLGCGAEATLLCTACIALMPRAAQCCYRCHRSTTASQTCQSCRSISRLHSLQAAFRYQGLAKDVVWKLKLGGAQSASRLMAVQMLAYLGPLPNDSTVVPVPTASSRARRRGYDQAELLARELCLRSRLPYTACLTRTTQTEQHGARRDTRLTQLAEAFRVIKSGRVQGRHLILVDDVATTGATLEAAAAALKAAGAARIDAVVFAQV